VKITPIRTPMIEKGQSLLAILQESLLRPLCERDIICVASKVVSLEQERIVDLATVEPSPAARAMRQLDTSTDPEAYARLMELILREGDCVFETDVIWLTLKDGILIANAGIDLSNAPAGHAILWPECPWDWAHDFWQQLRQIHNVRELGIIVTDARSIPLRRGFIGMALAYSGFEGVVNQKGMPDLFGRPLRFTEKTMADGLAASAVLLGGEADERTPFVLIEDAPVTFTDRKIDPSEITIKPHSDIFASLFSDMFKSMAT